MQKLIANLFIDNPKLIDELYRFLERDPAFLQAEKLERDLGRALMARLPEESQALFLDYEAAANAALSLYGKGCYLFGLDLKRQVRDAVWRGEV